MAAATSRSILVSAVGDAGDHALFTKAIPLRDSSLVERSWFRSDAPLIWLHEREGDNTSNRPRQMVREEFPPPRTARATVSA